MIRYRPFELHTHTVHSDGDFTPAALVQAAHDFGCAGIAPGSYTGLDVYKRQGETA